MALLADRLRSRASLPARKRLDVARVPGQEPKASRRRNSSRFGLGIAVSRKRRQSPGRDNAKDIAILND
jgi:hypothetical protein